MSLLEDLEQEAQRRKATVDDAQQRKIVREEFFKTQIEPRIAALEAYLQKLVTTLKVLRPVKPWRYTLPGYGEVVAYSDHDYELKQTNNADSREIRLTFGCTINQEECPVVEQEGVKVKALASTFQRYQLGGAVLEPKKDTNGEIISAKFRARGRVPLVATFSADADGTAVKMSFGNFDSFGTALKTLSIGQLNDRLFDELGRYLMREENSLFREALPENYREQLRSSVERDRVKKRWEFKIASQRSTELEALKRQHGGESLLGRLRGLIGKKER